jgi:IS5 family transposase
VQTEIHHPTDSGLLVDSVRVLSRLVKRAKELVTQVIGQTRSRVLEGKKVPSGQKVLSLFEPHTRAIPRHKGGALVEFGRHVMLDEVEGGIVTRYQILEHPEEHGQAIGAVEHHRALFEHPPNLVAGDRGVHSADTEERLWELGVKQVAIPAEGKLSEERKSLEHTRVFRRGYRWRAGIEGRIASLRRDYGWRKSAYHGQEGMERWLGLGVLASNLRHIAHGKGA